MREKKICQEKKKLSLKQIAKKIIALSLTHGSGVSIDISDNLKLFSVWVFSDRNKIIYSESWYYGFDNDDIQRSTAEKSLRIVQIFAEENICAKKKRKG